MNSQESSSYEEKRKYPRKRCITPVEYIILLEPKGSGLIKNISEGGLGLLIYKYLPPQTIIKVKFTLPEDEQAEPIETVGKIVWCRETENGYLAGLQFLT